MFEHYIPKAETIDPVKFNELLEDPEFKSLVKDVEDKMIFKGEDGSVDEEGRPESFETASGYEDSLGEARLWLGTKGVRITDKALAKAIAGRMGGERFADLIN